MKTGWWEKRVISKVLPSCTLSKPWWFMAVIKMGTATLSLSLWLSLSLSSTRTRTLSHARSFLLFSRFFSWNAFFDTKWRYSDVSTGNVRASKNLEERKNRKRTHSELKSGPIKKRSADLALSLLSFVSVQEIIEILIKIWGWSSWRDLNCGSLALVVSKVMHCVKKPLVSPEKDTSQSLEYMDDRKKGTIER